MSQVDIKCEECGEMSHGYIVECLRCNKLIADDCARYCEEWDGDVCVSCELELEKLPKKEFIHCPRCHVLVRRVIDGEIIDDKSSAQACEQCGEGDFCQDCCPLNEKGDECLCLMCVESADQSKKGDSAQVADTG